MVARSDGDQYGKLWSYSTRNARVHAIGSHAFASFDLQGETDWHGTFRPPPGGTIARGRYTDNDRWQMDVSGDGRGCNQLSGEYTIEDVTFDQRGLLDTLDLSFEQHCERRRAALRGVFEYRAGDATPDDQ
jgi:hypothetical protein